MEQIKKVLVIGCNGMAGHVVKLHLEETQKYDVWGIARNIVPEEKLINLDISDVVNLEKVFKQHEFDVVVNCVGLLNKTAEDNPELAVWFNGYFPHLLAKFGNVYNFKLIHISTDCVFSGKEGNYKEDDFKNGIGFYAQSKAIGEVINLKDLTFRTSIIGPELKEKGIGLFHWFMNQKKDISGFTEAYWSGVTTIELAKAIGKVLNQDLTGIYHLTNNKKIDKYKLLQEFNTLFKNKSINIIPNSDYKVDKSLINTRSDFDYSVPSYTEMIAEMKNWMEKYNKLYKHYQLL
ncbi:SDR family oxidoreductase [Tenacibaculum caenipelagi]|uniref:dTDP-4-dehydrorhamnose reductase n=1 Tax=Tenacibaculum caenipelagi TaxID=1325435 RepID=A0A4R6TCG0_9FLAO|nr:SDR family oxidoreductase [Tenacibaculum caenipelagi]TDQ24094.1 dTDP-4-dehydrorhamnose reductase [Tenacibaculum caenipelagi]